VDKRNVSAAFFAQKLQFYTERLLFRYLDEKHQIHFQMPEDWPRQSVKVVMMLLETKETVLNKKRTFGQFKCQVNIADNFDAELPDESMTVYIL
jgi:hypothetical protein